MLKLPDYISEYNIFAYELDLEIHKLKRQIDQKKAFRNSIWEASAEEEVLYQAELAIESVS